MLFNLKYIEKLIQELQRDFLEYLRGIAYYYYRVYWKLFNDNEYKKASKVVTENKSTFKKTTKIWNIKFFFKQDSFLLGDLKLYKV